jgi:hypothetical protein
MIMSFWDFLASDTALIMVALIVSGTVSIVLIRRK